MINPLIVKVPVDPQGECYGSKTMKFLKKTDAKTNMTK